MFCVARTHMALALVDTYACAVPLHAPEQPDQSEEPLQQDLSCASVWVSKECCVCAPASTGNLARSLVHVMCPGLGMPMGRALCTCTLSF